MECFAALGLADTATAVEVRFAYHNMARELHPDGGGNAEAFTALRENYAKAMREVSARKCVTCGGKKRVTYRVGWSSVEVRCPTCG
jgi:hypothetical protein